MCRSASPPLNSRTSPTTSGCPARRSRIVTAASSSPQPAPQFESGASITRVARYDLITIDTNARRAPPAFEILGSLLFTTSWPAHRSPFRRLSARTRKAKVAGGRTACKTKSEGFAVALQANNKAVSAATIFASEGAARDWMADAVVNDRSLAGRIHVVPEFELAA